MRLQEFLELDNWSPSYTSHCMSVIYIAVLMNIWINMIAAFIASWTRGFLAPVGFTVVALVMSNFLGMLGWSAYYPWSVSMLFAENGIKGIYPGAISIVVVLAAGLIGLAGVLYRWRYADQN